MRGLIKRFLMSSAFIAFFSGSALAERLECTNFYDHFGKERAVVFSGLIKDHSHIPDALFILDDSDALMTVYEEGTEGHQIVLETNKLELIYADRLTDVLSFSADNFDYFLVFDRANATMNIRYSYYDGLVESSVDTSLCSFD